MKLIRGILRKFVHVIIIRVGNITFLRKNYEKKIIIIKTDALGDFILFSPSFEYLKKYYADYKIDIIVKDYLKLIAEQCPYINEVIIFNNKMFRINLFYKLIILYQIYRRKYEICINPVYSRDYFSDEMAVWTGAKSRIGWENEEDGANKTDNLIYNKLVKCKFDLRTHEIERNKLFLQKLGVVINVYKPNKWIIQRTDFTNKLWDENKLNKKIIIALFPGKMTKYKGWESKKFINLINFLNERIENLFILISGTSKDRSAIEHDKRQPILNICGKTNILELYDLINRVDLVIGYDSAPIHLAILVGTKSLCLLGGGHFGRFFPYGDPMKHKFIYNIMPCYNCNWNCIYQTTKCIDEILEETVGKIIVNDLLKKDA